MWEHGALLGALSMKGALEQHPVGPQDIDPVLENSILSAGPPCKSYLIACPSIAKEACPWVCSCLGEIDNNYLKLKPHLPLLLPHNTAY